LPSPNLSPSQWLPSPFVLSLSVSLLLSVIMSSPIILVANHPLANHRLAANISSVSEQESPHQLQRIPHIVRMDRKVDEMNVPWLPGSSSCRRELRLESCSLIDNGHGQLDRYPSPEETSRDPCPSGLRARDLLGREPVRRWC
jgi:hypothetical protein